MKIEFADRHAAHLRGCLLYLLDQAGVECTLAQLRGALARSTMHDPALDKLRLEAAWLAERGLLISREVDGVFEGALITDAGRDAARGRKRVPGVAADLDELERGGEAP